ncbi:MAG: transposase [bacterium]|nr:transposase [bacterium]
MMQSGECVSPWRNPCVERLIGSIRRECLSHVIVLNKRYLLRILRAYLDYHHHARAHLSLDHNPPVPRQIEPPESGEVIAILQVGGLHHRFRCAAEALQAVCLRRSSEVEVRATIPQWATFMPGHPTFPRILDVVSDECVRQLTTRRGGLRLDEVFRNHKPARSHPAYTAAA